MTDDPKTLNTPRDVMVALLGLTENGRIAVAAMEHAEPDSHTRYAPDGVVLALQGLVDSSRIVLDAVCPMQPRTTAELPPIEDLPMHDIQPRTPIDPPTRILGVVFKGNTDLNPTARSEVSAYRDCTVCGGSGASRGHWCHGCKGAGKVAR